MGNGASALAEQSWTAACANKTRSLNLTMGFVDQNGFPMSFYNKTETLGITYKVCLEQCGAGKMYQAFRFGTFASSFTNWLLPWIALTAQLPYEASGPGSNIMSGLMAVGSPALITYSLSLTILNRCWIRGRFKTLRKESQEVERFAPHLNERIAVAALLLQEAQQAPIRIIQEEGWLSSLIVLPENQAFWRAVKKDLVNTRRGFSASLLAQMLVASIAYLLTVISAFIGNFDDSLVSLQVASGSIWIWMIPVILGWIFVGTQCRNGAIHDALHDASHNAHRARSFSNAAAGPSVQCSSSAVNVAIHDDSDLKWRGRPSSVGNTQLLESGKQLGIVNQSSLSTPHSEVPTWLGFSVNGDEGEDGPIFNYSRVFTWFHCADGIEHGFRHMLSNLRQNSDHRRRVDGEPWDEEGETWRTESDCFVGTNEQVAQYCGLPLTAQLEAYLPWSQMPAHIWHRIILASLMAVFVQWGTTGPGILIAYLTPTVGLGCRSGSYLLYGLAATVSWFLLLTSSILSHGVMLRYQQLKGNYGKKQEELRRLHSPLCALVVCTRYAGKIIAVANAVWLITSSLLESIGSFNNCWCDVNFPGMGYRGWAAVFLDEIGPVNAAPGYSIGGVTFSSLVCAVSLAFFCLAGGAQGGEG